MNKDKLKNILMQTRLCQDLKTNEIDLLIAHSKMISYSPRRMILHQGKIKNAMYIIIKGEANVVARILGEGVTQLAMIGKGNFFGEICCLEKRPCAASIIAKTSMECLCITAYYFDTLALFFPETKYKITHAVVEEVIERIIVTSSKIIRAMAKSNMVSPLLPSKKAEQHKEINFDQLDITRKQLKACGFFKSLTLEEFKDFLKYASLIKTPKHYTLLHEGTNKKTCYLILRGAVQLFLAHGQKKAKLSVLGPMDFFCNITLIESDIPSIIRYESYEQAILFKMDEEQIEKIKKHNLSLWYKIFDLLGKSFIALERAADELEIRLQGEAYNMPRRGK